MKCNYCKHFKNKDNSIGLWLCIKKNYSRYSEAPVCNKFEKKAGTEC